jgi:branched-chain amino acid transport system ATP-binding protein
MSAAMSAASAGDGLRLRVAGLRAGYGSLEAVSGISLEVGAGEMVALIGRNGAGKSTAVMAAAGMRFGPSSGTVTLGEANLSRASTRRVVEAGLSLVPAEHRIFRTLTVAENLKLGGYCRRRAGRAETAAAMRRVFDLFPVLQTHAGRSASYLSGGEQQMVAIGQALMANPSVLMLDEPTSGLSPAVISVILDALDRLRAQGLGILLVEQSVKRALARSDRCYVMERGQILLSGRSADIAGETRVLDIVRGTAEAQIMAQAPSGTGAEPGEREAAQ